MPSHAGRGTEAVTYPRNEIARRVAARRARFVSVFADPLAFAYQAMSSVTASPIGENDGIDILRHGPYRRRHP
jgi:hypothetical protein